MKDNIGSFGGKILTVDLSSNLIVTTETNYSDAEKYLGGLGLGIKHAYDTIKAKIDPLSVDNAIIISAGALVGTNVPGASRIFAITKLPATGGIGWCGGGGMNFGYMMKAAGYDIISIKGKCETPKYLKIFDSNVELCDASDLWGQGIDKTSEYLYSTYGKKVGTIAIGRAGENLVKFSLSMIDRASSLGRGGLGAVFGSKNLKCIVIKGTKGIGVADSRRFKKICSSLFKRIRSYPLLKDWHKYGFAFTLPKDLRENLRNKLVYARTACIGCPIGDKDCLKIKDGQFKGYTKSAVSVSNILIMGLFGLSDWNECTKILGELDDSGMDMFEFFGVMKFAQALNENGLLKGFKISKFEGSYENLSSWIKKIEERKDLGDIMADGVDNMISVFGKESKLIAPATSKGMITYISPKGPISWDYLGTMELGQILGQRGPHMAPAGSPTYYGELRPVERFPRLLNKIGIPDETVKKILPDMKDLRVGMLLKYAYDNFMVLGSLGICARAQINRFYYADIYGELFSSATGIELDKSDLLKAGERIYNLLRLANIREGSKFMERDKIPEVWLVKPLFKEYISKKTVTGDAIEDLIDEYYTERGWDKNGIPTKDKIRELGLTEEANFN